MKTSIAVIGNGTMTLNCVQHMLAHDDCDIKVILTNPDEINPNTEKRIRNICETQTIQYIHTDDLHSRKLLSTLEKLELDYIMINFHNSPLPMYRGANAPSWAIINDEKEFGVTWHFLDAGVDTGEILWKETFGVSANETARSLIFKSVEAGIKLFKQNFHTLLESEPKTEQQPEEGSRYFRRDIPNGGYIDFSWPARKIDCMVRGLDFRPFENTFIRKVKNIEAGKILSVSSDGIEITTADGIILIQNMSVIDSGETIDFMSVNVNY